MYALHTLHAHTVPIHTVYTVLACILALVQTVLVHTVLACTYVHTYICNVSKSICVHASVSDNCRYKEPSALDEIKLQDSLLLMQCSTF